MADPLKGVPRHGDVYGDPNPGHEVKLIWAAVLIHPDGSEGLLSSYTFDDAGNPTGRVTFVTSDPKMLPLLKQALTRTAPPAGGRIEWREYTAR